MTVKELIVKLKQFKPNLQVEIGSENWTNSVNIKKVEKEIICYSYEEDKEEKIIIECDMNGF